MNQPNTVHDAATALHAKIKLLFENIKKVIFGKDETIRLVLTTILSSGHLLIEDVPGVGKTMLARALAQSVNLKFQRIQFTPDILPSDITGVFIFNQKNSDFEFKPGPLFANIVLADEINRATPRTQSALLESMGEYQVTVDGNRFTLPRPFMVIATQNSVEFRGTYPLPESQMDRFLMKIHVGYPESGTELLMVNEQKIEHPITRCNPVLSHDDILRLQEHCKSIYIAPDIMEYAVQIVSATRRHPDIALGSSPRGSLSFTFAARAMAFLENRDYVLPDDIKKLCIPVLSHRIILHPEARARRKTAETVLSDILQNVPVPAERADAHGNANC